MGSWTRNHTKAAAELRAVSDILDTVGTSIFLQLDAQERRRLAGTALALYRRGFTDLAKLRIVCRTAVFSWSN